MNNIIFLFMTSELTCQFILFHIVKNTILIKSISVAFVMLSIFSIFLYFYINRKRKRITDDIYYKDEIFNVIGFSSDNVFWIYDTTNSKYEYISPNFEKVLQISKKAITEDSYKILNYLPVDKRDKVLDLFHSTGDIKILEEDFEYIKPVTKERCWIMLRLYPILNHNRIVRFLCFTTDITKEKQSEKALEEALSSLSRANEAKKLFLSHVSHELKTPINAIIGMTQIASYSVNDQVKIENCLNKINTSSRKLLSLINNILDVSKIDSEKLVLVNEPFHLSEIITTFSSIMNAQAELSKQDYSLVLNDIRDDFLLGDSLRLVQILENCISNSIKFTPPEGKIKLEVTEVEKHANKARFSFVISDTGKGMGDEYLKHIFEPFGQEDNSIIKKYGGTGIGMTIVKELVNLMGGNINVTSKINAGTTITINIVFQISNDLYKLQEVIDSSLKSNQCDCKGLRALLVEDNEINLEIARELLGNINLDVETAINGSEAIKLFEASEKGYYDVILIDILMPELDGYETTKIIRGSTHPDAKTICIVAMTADDLSDNQLYLDCGMNCFVTKSFDFQNIYAALQVYLPKSKKT